MDAVSLRERADHLVRPAVVLDPATDLRTAATALWSASAGVAVVGTATRPIGILSERDVVMALAQGADPDTVTTAEAMTPRVIAVRPDDRLLDVAYLMFDDVIRHVPVVDEYGELTGVVSVRDLLRPLLVDALGGAGTADADAR
jgi:CBS domain-containing protein